MHHCDCVSVSDNPPRSAHALHAAAGLAPGVATAVAMWVLWWLSHLPAWSLPPLPLAVLLAAAMCTSLVLWTRWTGRRAAPVAGLTAGLTAAALNLLLLGSIVSEQATTTDEMATAANRLRDGAPAVIAGFLTLSAAAGLAAGLFGRAIAPRAAAPPAPAALAALAAVAAIAFVPLIVVGGAVTSTESGMAVPDAVTSYGSISFLMPISLMAGDAGEPRIFLEHTHRLFGSLVGLVTLLVAVATWRIDRRPAARALATAVFLLVAVQGALGALRVGENSPVLAMLHGVFGQLVFASAVTLAALLTARTGVATSPRTAATARRARGVSTAALLCVVVQLSLGATSRHLGTGHATWAHAAFAFIVVGVVFAAAALARSAHTDDPGGRTLRRVGTATGGLILVQFLLGFVALWQVLQPGADRPIPDAAELHAAAPMDVFEAVVTTAHQTVGAALLALTTLGMFWARRLAARPEIQPAAARTPDITGA